MEIDRKFEPLHPRQDRPEETVVEIPSAMMAVDDDASESTLAHRTLELGDRGRRIGDRQRRQAEEPRRMASDGVASAAFVLRAKVFASSTSSCSTPGAVSDSA
jgi:hypothetical protein